MKKNLAQEQVINTIDGQLIVIACPGSGKTTTLLRRINHMVECEFINPSEILMITFTNSAAKEMEDRYIKNYKENPGITFCTIHSLCVKFLQKFDCLDMDRLITNQFQFIEDIVNVLTDINDLKKFTTDVLMDISVVKNNKIDIENYKPICCEDKQVFINVFNKYERKKKEEEKFDFDDLLIKTYKIIKSERDALDWLRDTYAYIHVDEYQDTNFIQRDIIYAITGENGNLTVVGDDDQSIYAFRGAKPEIMLHFNQKYPDAIEIHMSTNYRSDKSIIDSASTLIQKNKKRFPKDIKANSSQNGEVIYKQFNSKNDEVINLGNEIKTLINNDINPNDIAILYRTNSQSLPITDMLFSMDIPFFTNDNIENRYNSFIFKDIMAYHRLVVGEGTEKQRQEDFLLTLKHPNRYFNNISKMKYSDDLETIKQKANNPFIESWKNENQKKDIEKYFLLLSSLKNLPPSQMIDELLERGNYKDYLISSAKYLNMPSDELYAIIERFKYDIDRKSIKTFKEWRRYSEQHTRALEKIKNKRNGVCISTMHKSKGLEWKYVFIVDCIDTIYPFIKATTEEELEEERRLFYVAMTRAKNKLYLYSYKSHTTKNLKESRFLKEANILM